MANVIHFEMVENARELGGILGAGGKRIKHGKLIRCGNLSKATDKDMLRIRDEFGVKTVIDFRSEFEFEPLPDKTIDGVTGVHFPLLDDSLRPSKSKHGSWMEPLPGMTLAEKLLRTATRENMVGKQEQLYSYFMDGEFARKQYHDALMTLLEQKGNPTLWHCTSGKDRAGYFAVYILAALGVSDEDILDDFAESAKSFEKPLEFVMKEVVKLNSDERVLDTIRFMVSVKREYMERSFVRFNSEFGSALDFVRNQLRITDEQIEQLRSLYLE